MREYDRENNTFFTTLKKSENYIKVFFVDFNFLPFYKGELLPSIHFLHEQQTRRKMKKLSRRRVKSSKFQINHEKISPTTINRKFSQ